MLFSYLFIASIKLLLAAQAAHYARQPDNWQQLYGTGISGKVKTLGETTYRQMSLMTDGKYVQKWDTLSAREYTFDERGNLTAHKFRKRRPQNMHGEQANYYSDLLLHVQESYTFDDSNNLVRARTWMENGQVNDNWEYSGARGIHTSSYEGSPGDTEIITVSYYDDIRVFDFETGGCLNRRTFSGPDYDSTVYYRDCGKKPKRITTFSRNTDEGITEVTRMNFEGGLWAGTSTKTYDGRVLEEKILDGPDKVAEQTIYSYGRNNTLTEETVFDRNGKQLKKVTYTYDDKGSKTEETQYGTGKVYEWKTKYVNEYDEMQRLKKQTATTSYPGKNTVTTPPTTKLLMGYDYKGNVLREMTISVNGNLTDSVIVMRNISYYK